MTNTNIVVFKIIASDSNIDTIKVQHNDPNDADTKLKAYFATKNAHMIPGLSLWALYDNAPKGYYKTIYKSPEFKINVKRT